MIEVSESQLMAPTEVVRAWTTGWSISRGVAQPVAVPGGFSIEVGLPDQVRRFVLPVADRAVIRDLVEQTDTPGTWLKVFAPEEEVLPLLTPDWEIRDPGFLMTTTLRQAHLDVPAGYAVRTSIIAGIIVVQVLAADGQVAARGQMAVAGPDAIADQIVTEADHRRRGLGSIVMGTLGNEALAQGAQRGILGASVEGRALYESIGWTMRALLTSATFSAVGSRALA